MTRHTNGTDKIDGSNGLNGSCRVINPFRLRQFDPGRSAKIKIPPIFIFILCVLLSSCIGPGVSSEYVSKSVVLASNVRAFEAKYKRKPATRRELMAFEKGNPVEPVTSWFTAVGFSHNKNGEFQIYSRKGYFLWDQGSGTATFSEAIH